MNWIARIGGLAFALMVADPVLALKNLGTFGPVVDVSDYVARVANSREPTRAATELVRDETRFPIESPGLVPGEVVSAAIDLPQLATPICVVGDDDYSIAWIQTVHQTLIDHNATCVVTNVANEEAVVRIRALLTPVPVFAAAANELLDPIGVQHYPVLVSRISVEQ